MLLLYLISTVIFNLLITPLSGTGVALCVNTVGKPQNYTLFHFLVSPSLKNGIVEPVSFLNKD